jgi:hypothetical protein
MLGHSSEHLEHHPAGGGLGVEVHPEDAKAGTLAFDGVYDLDQVAH